MSTIILDIQQKIELDPYNPSHYIALARAHLEVGDEEKARRTRRGVFRRLYSGV